MWQSIENAINDELLHNDCDEFIIKKKIPAQGGDINLSFQISDYQHNYFVKINNKDHLNNFESEAYALEQIKKLGQIACPDVVTIGKTLDKSFLVLSFIPLHQHTASISDKAWFELGQKLALMHQGSTHGQFGWQHDNYIGDTLQPNEWRSNWKTFFSEQRIGWQLQLLHEKSINFGDIDHIIDICHDKLNHHKATPCLVHGDLWQGNLGFTDSTPCIFDPASYYGDREVDIAMTELFGHLPYEFYQGYQSQYPLDDGYEQRKLVYNFYHVLNHANSFGGIYLEQAKAMMTRIFSLH